MKKTTLTKWSNFQWAEMFVIGFAYYGVLQVTSYTGSWKMFWATSLLWGTLLSLINVFKAVANPSVFKPKYIIINNIILMSFLVTFCGLVALVGPKFDDISPLKAFLYPVSIFFFDVTVFTAGIIAIRHKWPTTKTLGNR